ncbi:dynein regulatory complex subunit 2-like [Convolutriloba macropyga]|uniref:dynein regulatory complex subunit 2-like n=1 Tax=Convolutriloba macropyga TaxID=536237 RepID=UPI003F522950
MTSSNEAHVDFLNAVTDRAHHDEKGYRKSRTSLSDKEKESLQKLLTKSTTSAHGDGGDTLTQAYLDLKVQREEDKRKKNEQKANQVLRELLISVESEELRSALEQECRDFSRRMSAMDEEVERKVTEIKESDQQHSMLTQAFDCTIGTLTENQEDSINRLIHDYNMQLEDMLDTYNNELNDETVKHREKMIDLTDCMFALDNKFNDEEKDMDTHQANLKKFMELQGIRETQNLRIASESLIEEYWRHYEESLYKFNTETRKLKSELMKRRRVDESNAQVYNQQQDRVERLQRTLKSVKNRVKTINRETTNTLNAISREQKILFDIYMKLRQVLKENERVRDMQLTKLCTESEAALTSLKESLDLAERITKLGHMCRALESEGEKVTPFVKEEHLDQTEQKVLHNRMWKNFEEPLNKDVHIYSRVQKLGQRMSKATLDDATGINQYKYTVVKISLKTGIPVFVRLYLSVRAEISQYDKSIQWLKNQLKLYLEDISITSEAIDYDRCHQLLQVESLEGINNNSSENSINYHNGHQ